MTTNDFPPQLVLQQIIQGYQVTQCIYVAAKLGIADLLKDCPRTSEELAQATGTHAPSLYRVLRLLTAVDLLTEGEAYSFALTPLGSIFKPMFLDPCAIWCSFTVRRPLAHLGGFAPQRRNGRTNLSAGLRAHELGLSCAAP